MTCGRSSRRSWSATSARRRTSSSTDLCGTRRARRVGPLCETRMPDGRAPVLVGVAQLTQRPESLDDALEASALMTEVAVGAGPPAGGPSVLAAGAVGVGVKRGGGDRHPARPLAG